LRIALEPATRLGAAVLALHAALFLSPYQWR
jgi:hypothetical protein